MIAFNLFMAIVAATLLAFQLRQFIIVSVRAFCVKFARTPILIVDAMLFWVFSRPFETYSFNVIGVGFISKTVLSLLFLFVLLIVFCLIIGKMLLMASDPLRIIFPALFFVLFARLLGLFLGSFRMGIAPLFYLLRSARLADTFISAFVSGIFCKLVEVFVLETRGANRHLTFRFMSDRLIGCSRWQRLPLFGSYPSYSVILTQKDACCHA